MDLPKRNRYGVTCPVCTSTKWYDNQFLAEFVLVRSYPDMGLAMIDSPMGLCIGVGKFDHICKPLEIQKHGIN